MRSLEELRGKTPVLRSGFILAPPEREWLDWLAGLLAARRAGLSAPEPAEAVPGWEPAEVENDPRERLLKAKAPLPDLGWLADAHEAHEGSVARYVEAANTLIAIEARVAAEYQVYAAAMGEAVASGAPSPAPLDTLRAQVEVELARGKVAAAGVALAAAAEQAMGTLRAHLRDIRRIEMAVASCALPGHADFVKARRHPIVQWCEIVPLRLDVPENELQFVRRFEEASQELAGYSAASARRHINGALAHA